MPYSTIDDLKTNFDASSLVELTDDEGDGLKVDERLAAAIARADEEIDGYLAGRYSVPLSSVPPMVKSISIDLAIYELHKRRGDFLLDTKGIEKRRSNAIDRLKEIQKGVVSFTGGGEPNLAVSCSRSTTYTREFLSKY